MAKRLETPEEIKASKVKATVEYLKHAEDVLSELLGPIFGTDRIEGTDELDKFLFAAVGVRQLVMALRRYPRFDIACLSAMKKFTYVRRVGTEDVKLEVMVPTFATVDYRYLNQGAKFNLAYEQNSFTVGKTQIRFDFEKQSNNMRLYHNDKRLGGSQSWGQSELQAKVPSIPKDVKRRVSEAEYLFEEILFVWEAEWQNAPVEDPLIIGAILGEYFLIDKYDVTKLERYISSEMTSGPSK